MKKNSLIGLSAGIFLAALLCGGTALAQTNPAGNLHPTTSFRRGSVTVRSDAQRAQATRALQTRNSLQQLTPTTRSQTSTRTNSPEPCRKTGHQSWHPTGYSYPPTYPGRNAPLPQPGIDYNPGYSYGYGYNGYGYYPNYYRSNGYNPGPRANRGYTPYGQTRR